MQKFGKTTIFIWAGIVLIAGLMVGVLSGFLITSRGITTDKVDTSVVLEGETEYGYPNTTFLAGFHDGTDDVNLCGGVLVSPNAILTAGHCIVDVAQVGAITGQVDLNKSKLVPALNVYSPQNWDATMIENWAISKVPGDVAIVEMSQSFSGYSELGTAEIGCGYEVAGYGTNYQELLAGTGIDLTDGTRPKESIQVCIIDAANGALLLQPESGTGLCSGDSGSPLYIKGTNTVVGVISAVMQNEQGNFCDLDNYAVAVDISYQKEFLSNFASTTNLQTQADAKNDFDSRYEDITKDGQNREKNYQQYYDDGSTDFAEQYNSDYQGLEKYVPESSPEPEVGTADGVDNSLSANSNTIIIVVMVLLLCCAGLVILLVVVAVLKRNKKSQPVVSAQMPTATPLPPVAS